MGQSASVQNAMKALFLQVECKGCAADYQAFRELTKPCEEKLRRVTVATQKLEALRQELLKQKTPSGQEKVMQKMKALNKELQTKLRGFQDLFVAYALCMKQSCVREYKKVLETLKTLLQANTFATNIKDDTVMPASMIAQHKKLYKQLLLAMGEDVAAIEKEAHESFKFIDAKLTSV
jgi:hypothetical protein